MGVGGELKLIGHATDSAENVIMIQCVANKFGGDKIIIIINSTLAQLYINQNNLITIAADHLLLSLRKIET